MAPPSTPVSAAVAAPGCPDPTDPSTLDKPTKVICSASTAVQPPPALKAPARGSNQRGYITNKPVGGRGKERIPRGICKALEELKIKTDNKSI